MSYSQVVMTGGSRVRERKKQKEWAKTSLISWKFLFNTKKLRL